MLLASYLRSRGYEAQHRRDGENAKGQAQGAWEFDSDDELRRAAADFESGDARVEPRSFYLKAKETRSAMMTFLEAK